MATADPSEDFSGLYANGTAETFLNLTRGMDTLTIGFEDTVAGTAPVQQTFTYGIDFTTVQDLVNVVNDPANGFNTFFYGFRSSSSRRSSPIRSSGKWG